jgi:hypothetical protein
MKNLKTILEGKIRSNIYVSASDATNHSVSYHLKQSLNISIRGLIIMNNEDDYSYVGVDSLILLNNFNLAYHD